MGNFREKLGISELKDKKGGIWKALLAEFLGNFLLNFFGCASAISLPSGQQDIVLIALTFGLTIFIIVQVRDNFMFKLIVHWNSYCLAV